MLRQDLNSVIGTLFGIENAFVISRLNWFDLLSESLLQILVAHKPAVRACVIWPPGTKEFSAELLTLLLGCKLDANLLGKFALVRTLVVWPEIPYLDINWSEISYWFPL